MFVREIFERSIVFHSCPSSQAASVMEELQKQNCGSVTLDFSAVKNEKDMFDVISKAIVGRPDLGKPIWASLIDDIWHTLLDQPHQEFALLVKDCDDFMFSNMRLFLDFLEAFHSLSKTLSYNPAWPGCRRVYVRIVLFGRHPGFGERRC